MNPSETNIKNNQMNTASVMPDIKCVQKQGVTTSNTTSEKVMMPAATQVADGVDGTAGVGKKRIFDYQSAFGQCGEVGPFVLVLGVYFFGLISLAAFASHLALNENQFEFAVVIGTVAALLPLFTGVAYAVKKYEISVSVPLALLVCMTTTIFVIPLFLGHNFMGCSGLEQWIVSWDPKCAKMYEKLGIQNQFKEQGPMCLLGFRGYHEYGPIGIPMGSCTWKSFFNAFVGAGFGEELLKYCAIAIFYKNIFVVDYKALLVYALIAGTTFACVENVMYYHDSIVQGKALGSHDIIRSTLFLRGICCVQLHAFWAIITGAFLAKKKFLKEKMPFWKIIIIPVAMHGIYDFILFEKFWGGPDLSFVLIGICIVVGAYIIQMLYNSLKMLPVVDVRTKQNENAAKTGIQIFLSSCCCCCSTLLKNKYDDSNGYNDDTIQSQDYNATVDYTAES